MTRTINMAGQVFGRLTVLERAGSRDRKALWRCQCSCGKEAIVIGKLLRSGHTKSCGCWNSDINRQLHTVHGGAPRGNRTRLHGIWSGMKTRCGNSHCRVFDRYGGRGIRLCDEWQEFEPFRDWAKANGYADHLTIDRTNNNGNYEPANCRWIPQVEQHRNTRQNRAVIRSDGKRYALIVDAARELGCSHSGISAACRGKIKTWAGYEWKYDE